MSCGMPGRSSRASSVYLKDKNVISGWFDGEMGRCDKEEFADLGL